MTDEAERAAALHETLNAFYVNQDAARAIVGFLQYLEYGDVDHPAVLYTFARIANVSPEARQGFEALRERKAAYVDRVLRGPSDPAFPRPSEAELGPVDLDLLWSEFFVTGDPAPVLRVISVLDGADLVRERLGHWLRAQGTGFLGQRAIAKYRPMLVRCAFPIDYDLRSIEDGIDLDLHVALNARNGNLKFDELPIKLSTQERIRLATKSAALWSLRAIAGEHERVAKICASEAMRPGGAARRLLVDPDVE